MLSKPSQYSEARCGRECGGVRAMPEGRSSRTGAVSRVVPSTSHCFKHLMVLANQILITILGIHAAIIIDNGLIINKINILLVYHYLSFTDKDTSTKRDEGSCSRSSRDRSGLEPKRFDLRAQVR